MLRFIIVDTNRIKEAIDDIFTEMGLTPNAQFYNFNLEQKKEMMRKLRILYTDIEPYKQMKGWNVTRNWLKAKTTDTDVRNFLELNAPDIP